MDVTIVKGQSTVGPLFDLLNINELFGIYYCVTPCLMMSAPNGGRMEWCGRET